MSEIAERLDARQLDCPLPLLKAKQSGKYYQSVAREQPPDPHAANQTLQRLLWDATEELFRDVIAP